MKKFIALTLALFFILMQATFTFGLNAKFSDVQDIDVLQNIEILRLMGVIDGYTDGTFKPENNLTRAQFCKMAIYMAGWEEEAGAYKAMTVFPDVRASYWAAPFINLSAKGKHIIAGFNDGYFYPEKPITSGQAATILLKILGYSDENVSGIWPQNYLSIGEQNGLLKNCSFSTGKEILTRKDAAQIFVNMINTCNKSGSKLYNFSESKVFKSISVDTKEINLEDDISYTWKNFIEDSIFVGMKGKVLLNSEEKALSFIPEKSQNTIYSGIVIVPEDGSSLGFSQLAGGNSYKIYKNGNLASTDDIKKWDVALYNSETNCIRLCSDRVSAFYEDCKGSPKQPNSIEILGGLSFDVMDSAKSSVGKFKPGQLITFLFTPDGKIAGAVEQGTDGADSNLEGEVDSDGILNVQLCGKNTKIGVAADSSYKNKMVKLRSCTKEGLRLINKNGDAKGSSVYFALVHVTIQDDSVNVVFDCGPSQSFNFSRATTFRDGQFVAANISDSGNSYSWVSQLDKLSKVPNNTWLSTEAVTFGNMTYEINDDTLYYNKDIEKWSDIDRCLEYSTKTNMYVYEGIVRIVEFSAE